MSEMIERVARALAKAEGFLGADEDIVSVYGGASRAAIEAMREPSDLMGLGLPADYRAGSHSATQIWRAMIDAALAP